MAKPGVPHPHPAQLLQDALALHRQGRLDEAEKLYSRVLKIDRNQFDALHLLGTLNHQRGKAGEAYRLLVAALKVQPRSPDALANLGMVLHALKRSDEALAHFGKALELAPGHLEALNNRGNVLLAQGRAADALRDFEQVLLREPRHVQARLNRGHALAQLGEHERALGEFDAALSLHPQNPNAHYNRGTALHALGRFADAIAAFDRALGAMPRYAAAWYNRGLALQALNRHREAIESFRRARDAHPDHAAALYAEAASLLTIGDYREGFAAYEARWKHTGTDTRPRFRQPVWTGETPLAGRTILLHAEQGLGDTIQFARYVPLLVRTGARVVLQVQPELKALFLGLEGVSLLARGETLPAFDLQCPLASLPLALRTEATNVPADLPFLHAPDDALERWRARLAGHPGYKVALAWSGRASHANDANRSLTLAQLAPLFDLSGISFVSVQHEPRAADAERLAATSQILDLSRELHDFTDTAAVLSLCDLTLCVDTSVAHLAGALGRPLWVMLPFQPDWRWGLEARTPWYPAARLFRQPAPGDWASVINRLREALASREMPVT